MTTPRERVMRKAKDRAIEHLHEITSTYYKSSSSAAAAANASGSAAGTPAGKRANRSSYKHFPETTQQSDQEEQSDTEVETPKKATRARRKNTTTTTNAREANITRATNRLAKQQQQAQQALLQQQQSNLRLSANGEADLAESSLYNQILSGQASMQSIVDDWIEAYKKDKDSAMLELVQFVVRSSGCKGAHMMSDKEVLKSKEFTEPINELIEYFNDDDSAGVSEAYPMVQNSVQARRFKSNFCEFLQLLINQCQFSIIYDQFMLDILITFLIALADSQVRAFRHTSTLAVLKIMTALVDVLLALSISKDACQRQYENERQKSQLKRANDRMEMLQNKRKEIEENEYEIQNFINFIFKAVFIHRYRDVCADIRCVCINEIGEWMKKCPSKFLDDTFLKYIGWTLYDRVGECRLKCLQALQPLYEQDDLLARLELFTSRFKNRIVEMSIDKEYEVSVNAIKLLTSIVRQNDAALEDKDCENIYELVYHTNRQIAQAAGEFLKQKLFVKVENPPIEFRKGKKLSENANFIQLLVQFLIESELHDHPAYLVDAMWDIHPMMKDWECMTDLLLEDPLNPEDVLDDTHERFLIEIIACCVKQAATGEYPIARRVQANRKLTAKEAKQAQDDKVALTQHFIVTLPALLTKYIADAEKLVYLLQVPAYFDLNQYTVRRQEKNLEKLLSLLQEIVTKHNETEVLEECSKCLSFLCDEDNSIYSKCNIVRSTIMDDLVNAFSQSMSRFDQQSEADENEMYPLMIALKRLSAFADNHNISNYDLVSNTLTILKWAVYNEGFGHDFVNKSLNLARSLLVWNMHKLNQDMEERNVALAANDADASSVPVNSELIEFISKLSKKYYKLCNKLFVNENPQIEEEAFFEICDLLLLFNSNIVNAHKEYKPLIMECSTNDINMLSVFVMNNVFSEDALNQKADTSEKIEKLHKRRCMLAAFAKLICFNCVPIQYAAEIFRVYIKFAHSYGDIIKHLLSTCRDISKVQTAKAIALALQREFHEVQFNSIANKTGANADATTAAAGARIDRNSAEFQALKELAHRFCLSFGPEASVKSREAIVTIHQEVLHYINESPGKNAAVAPINLPFLEVITEFSSRLTAPDKRALLNELDKSFAKRANKIEENHWLPYYSYRLSLMEEGGGQAAANQLTKAAAAAAAAANATNAAAAAHSSSAVAGDDDGERSLLNRGGSDEVNHRKRKQNAAFKDTTNSDSTALAGAGRLEKTIPELEEYEDEENEELNAINSHTDMTTNHFDNLKLNSTENAGGLALNGRSTRATRISNIMGSVGAGGNKRSRSPLVSNNSINESALEPHNVLTSTRIESSRLMSKGPQPTARSGRATRRQEQAAAAAESANDNGGEDEAETAADDANDTVLSTPSSKRKRRSEENEDENSATTAKATSLRSRGGASASSVYVS